MFNTPSFKKRIKCCDHPLNSQQVAVVSPVFYWQWGNVLAKIEHMRAKWETPTEFEDHVKEVVGCIWEMDVVSFEINAWKATVLNDVGSPAERLATYLEQRFV